MNNDCIERILDDCTMSPKAYCHKHDCGQGVYDELADYVPDMCIHLVGRAVAVTRHTMIQFVDGNSEFHIGDRVIRKNGRTGEVIGWAFGKDGEHCLVLSMDDGHWRTYLCPIGEARKMKVPSIIYVKHEIQKAIESAASSDYYTSATAESVADYLFDIAHACCNNEPYPFIGGTE